MPINTDHKKTLTPDSSKRAVFRVIHCCLLFAASLFRPFTAAAITYTYHAGEGLTFAWQTDDIVGVTAGIVEDGVTEQLAFFASSRIQDACNDRKLYAVGFVLKPGMQYYAYYPYVWDAAFSASAIPFSYEGQRQRGNGSTAHLASYDISCASAMSSTSACEFAFRHLAAVLRIEFTAPCRIDGGTLCLTADAAVLPLGVSLNLYSQTAAITSRSETVTATLEEIGAEKGETVTAYVMLPACDLSANTLHISFASADGARHTLARIKAPDMKGGMLYDISLLDRGKARAGSPQRHATRPYATKASLRNPLAHAGHITTDPSYTVSHIDTPTAVSAPTRHAKPSRLFSIDGKEIRSVRKGMIYKKGRKQ